MKVMKFRDYMAFWYGKSDFSEISKEDLKASIEASRGWDYNELPCSLMEFTDEYEVESEEEWEKGGYDDMVLEDFWNSMQRYAEKDCDVEIEVKESINPKFKWYVRAVIKDGSIGGYGWVWQALTSRNDLAKFINN